MHKPKLRVGVLFGGRSGEHEVSLTSAASVLRALDPARYDVVPIGITHDGRWRLTDGAIGADGRLLLPDGDDDVHLLPEPGAGGALTGASGDTGSLDVIIPVLHGTFGEDGTVQGLLELAGIPYVGAGVLASAVGMDKAVARTVFAQAGLPQVEHRTVLRAHWEKAPQAVRAQCEAAFPYPWFVKPANLGSSVGISKVDGPRAVKAAFDEAAAYDRKLVVEAAVVNPREIELSVLGNDDPIVSVPGEIVPSHTFYDYRAKYVDDTSALIIPADLPEATVAQLQEMAIRAFRALDCAGLARADFLVRRADGAIFLNELNTMPGFTSISMYPKLWQASGVSYAELVDRLIELALDRHADRARNRTRFDLPT